MNVPVGFIDGGWVNGLTVPGLDKVAVGVWNMGGGCVNEMELNEMLVPALKLSCSLFVAVGSKYQFWPAASCYDLAYGGVEPGSRQNDDFWEAAPVRLREAVLPHLMCVVCGSSLLLWQLGLEASYPLGSLTRGACL